MSAEKYGADAFLKRTSFCLKLVRNGIVYKKILDFNVDDKSPSA